MTSEEFLDSRKKRIDRALSVFFDSSLKKFRRSGRITTDLFRRLRTFASRGKSIRGCLCLATAEMNGTKETSRTAMPAAMAVELIHSGFLIHDDIMDNDELRRGHPTVFAQYLPLARKESCIAPEELAVSLGICAGDIAYFLAETLLNSAPWAPGLKASLSACFNEEIVRVGLGQMDDVWWGAVSSEPSEEDIESIYRFKTSRYTFSLPCVMGGMIAGLPPKTLSCLAEAGEHTGIAFQLRDDELGLLSELGETGKPSGSDVRENKKTLTRLLLLRNATPKENKRLRSLFGNPNLDRRGIRAVRALYDSTGTRQAVESRIAAHSRKAEKLIRSLHVPGRYSDFLLWMLRYAIERKK